VSDGKKPESRERDANRLSEAVEIAPSAIPTAPGIGDTKKREHGVSLEAVHSRLNAIEASLCALLEQRLRYDEAKDRAFDVLYEKMRQFDGNFQASIKRNLVLSLLLLHDHICSAEAALEEHPVAQERVAGLRKALQDLLYAEDIEPMGALGDLFDRRRQQAIDAVATSDAALADTVERVVREGFLFAGKVLRPQSVIVRRHHGTKNDDKSTLGGQ
jgi:molecular chaperone GrpE (heat shock protein)